MSWTSVNPRMFSPIRYVFVLPEQKWTSAPIGVCVESWLRDGAQWARSAVSDRRLSVDGAADIVRRGFVDPMGYEPVLFVNSTKCRFLFLSLSVATLGCSGTIDSEDIGSLTNIFERFGSSIRYAGLLRADWFLTAFSEQGSESTTPILEKTDAYRGDLFNLPLLEWQLVRQGGTGPLRRYTSTPSSHSEFNTIQVPTLAESVPDSTVY
jgi:hypothetical protein